MRLASRLSPWLRIFVMEYTKDFNSKRAAMATKKFGNENTAASAGRRWIVSPEVQKAIREVLDIRSRRIEICGDSVLQEIANVAAGNVQDLYDDHGQLIPIHRLPRHVAATVSEVTEKVMVTTEDSQIIERKYKTYSRMDALNKLGANLLLFNESKTEKTDGNLNVTFHVNVITPDGEQRKLEGTVVDGSFITEGVE
jgi:hypothetical protein